MGHEISQFDISNRQLLATNAMPRVGMWTEIGEAKITRTIFGRARVRVICAQDKKRRAWLLTALAVMAIAATAWQGWIASQQTEPLAAPLPPLSARIRVSAPAFQPEDIPPSATSPSARSKSRTPTQIAIDNMTTRREPAPQQPIRFKPAGQMAAKQVTPLPFIAGKPTSAATNNSSSKNQVDMQQPFKLSDPIQPAAPVVATPPATQPEANRPAVATPLVDPLIKEDTQTQSPTGDNPSQGTVNTQP